MRKTQLLLALTAIGAASSAFATNGMNLEGYGPIAAAMGGASMGYDNGNAAVMNNPATLGLAADGSRLDLAVGMLGPDVTYRAGPYTASSGGDAYYMPAVGWTRKANGLTYGVAMFAQGGMGTEYAMGIDGSPERSELGVGRLIFPLAYNVNQNFSVGGSIDYVWAMLDMKMAMPLSNMGMMITPTGGGNGTLGGALQNLAMGGYDNARLDFSDGSDYTGKAKGAGFAGKLGFTYKVSPTVTLGGTYHTKTNLGDLKTRDGGAYLIATDNESFPAQTVPGKITVVDFQWPETYGLGVAIQATPDLLVALDVKHIGWKDVMKNFTMTYSAMGDSVTFAMPQNWDDQTVFQLGAAYKLNNKLTLRGGVNVSDNPIPSSTLNHLFPAIVKEHYTLGLGYALDTTSDLNFSLQHAPEVKQTSTAAGYTVSHSQTSWQFMYSKRF